MELHFNRLREQMASVQQQLQLLLDHVARLVAQPAAARAAGGAAAPAAAAAAAGGPPPLPGTKFVQQVTSLPPPPPLMNVADLFLTPPPSPGPPVQLKGNGTSNGMPVTSVYDGFVRESDKQPQGAGLRKWSNGEIQEGNFRGGKLHGQCNVAYPDGNVYVGEYAEGKAHGAGCPCLAVTCTRVNSETTK
jgi:hypothetical protein